VWSIWGKAPLQVTAAGFSSIGNIETIVDAGSPSRSGSPGNLAQLFLVDNSATLLSRLQSDRADRGFARVELALIEEKTTYRPRRDAWRTAWGKDQSAVNCVPALWPA
jgi:hypothetical protein